MSNTQILSQILSHNDPWNQFSKTGGYHVALSGFAEFFSECEKLLSFNFQFWKYTVGYLCCSQWSVIRHARVFSRNDYLFLCLDKSVASDNTQI